MDNGTQFTLTLVRLNQGGYVVQDGFGDPSRMMMQHFASTSIDEALKFIRDKISPIPPQAGPGEPIPTTASVSYPARGF